MWAVSDVVVLPLVIIFSNVQVSIMGHCFKSDSLVFLGDRYGRWAICPHHVPFLCPMYVKKCSTEEEEGYCAVLVLLPAAFSHIIERMENELKPPPGTQAPPVIQTIEPPAYMYSAQQPQVVQPATRVVVMQVGPTAVPGQMMCPSCRIIVLTRTEYTNGMLTWLICSVLGVLLIWPFCLIPLCVNSCKDVKHFCPKCDRVLHVYSRLC